MRLRPGKLANLSVFATTFLNLAGCSSPSGDAGPISSVSQRVITAVYEAKVSADDRGTDDFFGSDVALDGNTLVVGAARNDGADLDTGAAYVFVRNSETWTQQAKLLRPDGATRADVFGRSVSISGDTLVVGASQSDEDNSGAAYVFVRSGSSWTFEAKLTDPSATTSILCGRDVAIEGDSWRCPVPAMTSPHLMPEPLMSSGVLLVYGHMKPGLLQATQMAVEPLAPALRCRTVRL